MSFTESIKTCFSKILTIDGRARRSEFWWFQLGIIVINAVVSLLIGQKGLVQYIISIVISLASLTAGIRRLHDTGKSGWWMLLELIPAVGSIVLIIFWVMDSQPGANQYGPNPKGVY